MSQDCLNFGSGEPSGVFEFVVESYVDGLGIGFDLTVKTDHEVGWVGPDKRYNDMR